MIAPKTLKEQAEDYLARAGRDEVLKGAPYATGKICKCGNCFCCAVVAAIRKAAFNPAVIV